MSTYLNLESPSRVAVRFIQDHQFDDSLRSALRMLPANEAATKRAYRRLFSGRRFHWLDILDEEGIRPLAEAKEHAAMLVYRTEDEKTGIVSVHFEEVCIANVTFGVGRKHEMYVSFKLTDGGFVSVVHDIDNELGEFSHIPKLVRGSAGGSGVEELSCGALLIHHRLNEVLAAALENLARPRD